MIFCDTDLVKNDRVSEEIHSIVDFMNRQLFDALELNQGIFIWFERTADMAVDGYCSQDDDYEYTIEIDPKLRSSELRLTVIHELIHVYQYVTGSLYQEHIEGLGPRMYWMGEDHTSEEYENRPWEKQAHEIEETLYHKYNTNVA